MELIDRILDSENIKAAIRAVQRNQGAPGIDKMPVGMLDAYFAEHGEDIKEQIRAKKYQPQPVRRVYIPKANGKMRPLGIPTVRDRVVETSLKMVIEPIFESRFHPHSYGFRPGRGCKDALRQVDELLKAEHLHVVDVDIKGYFDAIPQDYFPGEKSPD